MLDTSGLSAIADGNIKLAPLLRRADEILLPVIVGITLRSVMN